MTDPVAERRGSLRRHPALKPALKPALVGAVAMCAAAAVVVRDPHTPGSFAVCPSLLLTGHYCPGCGSMRATHDLLTGHVAEAFGHNVLTIPALVWLAWWWLAWMVPALTGRRLVGPPSSAKFSIGLLTVLVVFTVLRNLPGSPLAP